MCPELFFSVHNKLIIVKLHVVDFCYCHFVYQSLTLWCIVVFALLTDVSTPGTILCALA
jgi:hypothetical protein